MFRFIAAVFVSLLVVACANPACPEGTEAMASGRCVPRANPTETMESMMELPAGDDAGIEPQAPDPDAAADSPLWMELVVPADELRLAVGSELEVSFELIRAPGFVGRVTYELTGLPPGVSATVEGTRLRLVAALSARAGERHVVDVRANSVDEPEQYAEATLAFFVVGLPGALDESFARVGRFTFMPLDGTEDSVVDVALDEEGTIVIAGNGESGAAGGGFVSWVDEEGRLSSDKAAAGTHRFFTPGARRTQLRGVHPTRGGVLVSVDADGVDSISFLDDEGDLDRDWSLERTPDRPVRWGGSVLSHDDGFLIAYHDGIERHQSDGRLDRAFGADGVAAVSAGTTFATAVFADGGFVTGGFIRNLTFERHDARGRAHLAYGARGVSTHEIPRAYVFASVRDIETLPDGSFLAAVTVSRSITVGDTAGHVFHVGATGELIRSFEHRVEPGEGITLSGVTVVDERILVWGVRSPGTGARHGFVAAHTLDGAHDWRFGDDGESGVRDLGDGYAPIDAVVDIEGRLVVGCDHTTTPSFSEVAVFRLWL